MATDIMAEHIYCLENINSKYNCCSKEESKISIYSMNKKKDRIHNTFGDNIHSLLKNSFIMNNTIGEFANQKIKDVIKDLTERTAEEIIKEEGRKQEIEYIIKNIGEAVIKRKLEGMYNKKFKHVEMNNKIEKLSNKVKELEKIIKENGLQ
ncbi:hypothetical protein [Clostridium cochlearium]|uniref:hypothetical protein n=1 Tax=Clostridium cochlearium TaxID=1494 RepID=UPI001570FF6C|nr:hypothetical protein [Clostridium cochlearium]MCG4581194.1 hypothetical protein [Clostridium cochlearium]